MNEITITFFQHNERNAEQVDKTNIELLTIENETDDSKEHIENDNYGFSENNVRNLILSFPYIHQS